MTISMVPCPGSTGTVYTTQNCIYDSATGTYEEIISEGPGGQYGDTFCTKSTAAAANMPGTAYAQKCYTRNAQGDLYSIYGSGAMPYTAGGQPAQRGQRAVSSADPQIFAYLNESSPGSLSRFMQKNRVMPWYTNTFGTRKSQMTMQEYDEISDEEETKGGVVEWFKSVFGAEEDEGELLGPGGEEQPVETEITGMQTQPSQPSNWPKYAIGTGLVGVALLFATGRIG